MPAQSQEVCPNIFPGFRYKDAPAAIEWLGKAFGFQTMMSVPGPNGAIMHAELILGRGIIMLGSERDRPVNPSDTAKQGVYVYVADVDAHYARAKAAGARVARELQDTPYGSREYSVWDPEGFLWSFGNYLPELGGASSGASSK
jgi:uncharacterized glyoxalase superfamily protein PhnB